MKNHRLIIAALLLIILIGVFLRFYELGDSAFDRDEFFELNSSYGYYKTGNFLAWDFNHEQPFPAEIQDDSSNERAEVFRWQLAQLYRLHEPTEFLARALGAAWGVIGIWLVYLVTMSLTGNRYIALIAALLTAIGESEIIYSRRLRMYAMFFPAYLFFSWMIYKFYESKYRGRNVILKKINEKIGFNPAYFLPVLVAGLVSYNVHVLTLNIAATIGAFAVLSWLLLIIKRNREYLEKPINKYSITLFGAFVGYVALNSPLLESFYRSMRKNFKFFASNPDFFYSYFSDWNHWLIGVVLIVLGFWYLFWRMKMEKSAMFLLLSGLVPMLLAVFVWRREESHRYIYFLQSFGIILAAAGIYGVIEIVTSRLKKYKILVIIMLLAGAISLVDFGYIYSDQQGLYGNSGGAYSPNFRAAHEYINGNLKPEDVMITRAYRGFYWRGRNIEVYDIKNLRLGRDGCEQKINEIVKEKSSGWAVYASADDINVCKAGRDYYRGNLQKVTGESVPPSISLYRWGN